MNKADVKKEPVLFLQSIEEQAGILGFETKSLKDKGKTLGLIIFETGKVVSQVARLLRKTAILLTENEGNTELRQTVPLDSCQVSVEEKAQLFSFFGKGAE